jgi:hypothetical protein
MSRSRYLSAFAFLGGSAVLIGCGTIKSKIYDSDNVTSEDRQIKHLRGIPETVDVPTHIKIVVMETRYYRGPTAKVAGSGKAAQSVGNSGNPQKKTSGDDVIVEELKKVIALQINELQKLDATNIANNDQIKKLKAQLTELTTQLDAATERVKEADKYAATSVEPTRTMKYEIISKKELFAVDFKRPISGKSDLKLEYGGDSGQFFKKVSQDITDTSIKDIGNLVSQIATALPKIVAVAGEADKQANELGLHAVNSVVAVEYFDIHTPHVEQRIQEFLDHNINCCATGCGQSVRPLPGPNDLPIIRDVNPKDCNPTDVKGIIVPAPAPPTPMPKTNMTGLLVPRPTQR